MIRKTASRHLANLIGLTTCQSAPRRRAHLVDTALKQAPWLRPLALLLLPLLYLHMLELLLLLHLAHEATWLHEEVSVALVVAVASVVTLRLVVEEALVDLASAEAEAVVLLQAASAVGRVMLSASSKISRNIRARLLGLEAHSLLKVLRHLSAKTAARLPQHILAPSDSHPTVKPFPILPQALAPALPPLAARLYPTVVQLNHQFPQDQATPTSATTPSPLVLPVTAAANQKSTTPSPLSPPAPTATHILPCAVCPKSFPAAAKPLLSSIAHASTSSTTKQRSCVA